LQRGIKKRTQFMGNTDENLISDILTGDVEAYAILVKRYQKPIFNLMMRTTSCEEDAFDLTQEAFVRAYEKLERFKPSGRFFPWLYTIGMNLARDFSRKTKTRKIKKAELYEMQKTLSVESDRSKSLLERIDAQRVKEVLQDLPLEYREAVILRFHEGMSIREVASSIGISVSGAKMRIHRGLLKLRRLLSAENSNGT
jgi:RNA polymerase sigma-70 factor (ECF subfamily)